jgi:GNAT superfamily N-acetyltransferase
MGGRSRWIRPLFSQLLHDSSPGPGIYLEDVFVHPEYRGRGIGKALLLELARLARERDADASSGRCSIGNEPSIRFYESLGARAMKEWMTA